jgi:hypothetical protein
MRKSQEECLEDGGQWDADHEVCSLDLEWDSGMRTQATRISSGMFTIAGAILTVPIITSPIGIPLLVYGIARQLLPDQSGYAAAIALMVSVLFWGLLAFVLIQVAGIIPEILNTLQGFTRMFGA